MRVNQVKYYEIRENLFNNSADNTNLVSLNYLDYYDLSYNYWSNKSASQIINSIRIADKQTKYDLIKLNKFRIEPFYLKQNSSYELKNSSETFKWMLQNLVEKTGTTKRYLVINQHIILTKEDSPYLIDFNII